MTVNRLGIQYRNISPLTRFFLLMSEDNMGAAAVLKELFEYLKRDRVVFESLMRQLDDCNIRGSQLWVACNDHCNRDPARLEACILDGFKRVEMVTLVNQFVSMGACDLWIACMGGAAKLESSKRPSLAFGYFGRSKVIQGLEEMEKPNT